MLLLRFHWNSILDAMDNSIVDVIILYAAIKLTFIEVYNLGYIQVQYIRIFIVFIRFAKKMVLNLL